MAWIESHQELRDHPKTIRLTHLLGVHRMQAIGHLHALWWWCLSYADNGDLARFEYYEIAMAAGWDGDPEAFVKALAEAGWLEGDLMVVHDWEHYGGKLAERRRADAERKSAARRKEVRRKSGGRAMERRTDGVRREENTREENTTTAGISEPKASTTPQLAVSSQKRATDPTFEALYEATTGSPYEGQPQLTSRERGILNRAAKELRSVGATPGEILRRAGHFLGWVGQLPTADNLVTHWTRLANPQQRATPDQLAALQRAQDDAARRARLEARDRQKGLPE